MYPLQNMLQQSNMMPPRVAVMAYEVLRVMSISMQDMLPQYPKL